MVGAIGTALPISITTAIFHNEVFLQEGHIDETTDRKCRVIIISYGKGNGVGDGTLSFGC